MHHQIVTKIPSGKGEPGGHPPRSLGMSEIETLHLVAAEGVPNHPTLPVVIRRGAAAGLGARAIRDRMEGNGWGATWTWTVFPYHHYHPNAHEALCVASGEADLTLGGPGGPRLTVRAGDLMVLPAGTGHKRESQTEDFRICGAYPAGQEDYETRRAEDGPGNSAERIACVGLPGTDPLDGAKGPLMGLWTV